MTTPKCPRNCYDKEIYVVRLPERDTTDSQAYLCCACGTGFYINICIRPKSEEKREWEEKYGTKEDI